MRLKLLSIAQSLRLPTVCILCKQFHTHPHAVCNECIALLPALGPSCSVCAHPLVETTYFVCGNCIKKPPHFDKTITAYQFVDPLRSLLHRFKYEKALYLGSFFAQLILNAYLNSNEGMPQCLIPVPMHRKKIHTRGFNQSIILTRFLARKLNIPYDLSACQKITHTASQAYLNKAHRTNNLNKVFRVNPLPYTHIALIDDLLTTGATANELAKQCKKAGAEQIDIWCCARAV